VDDLEVARRAIKVLCMPGVREDLKRHQDDRGALLLLYAAYASGLYIDPGAPDAPVQLTPGERPPYRSR